LWPLFWHNQSINCSHNDSKPVLFTKWRQSHIITDSQSVLASSPYLGLIAIFCFNRKFWFRMSWGVLPDVWMCLSRKEFTVLVCVMCTLVNSFFYFFYYLCIYLHIFLLNSVFTEYLYKSQARQSGTVQHIMPNSCTYGGLDI